MSERLRPGDVIYDLGANSGLFSLLAARVAGSTGKIFSFEPDAQIAERLRRNAACNSFYNITVVPMGVWAVSGTCISLARILLRRTMAWGSSTRMELASPVFRLVALRSMICGDFTPSNATLRARK